MKIMRDGREVDPALFGVVVPLQKGKRLTDTNEWPPMGEDDMQRSRDMVGLILVVIVFSLGMLTGAMLVTLFGG